jgi:DHA3 family macrolide efflux protein-like MFS transporter
MEEDPAKMYLGHYFLMWTGYNSVLMVNSIVYFILIWYITITMESALILSLIYSSVVISSIIALPFAGVFSDVLDRKVLLLVANSVHVVLLLCLVFLFVSGTAYPFLISILLVVGSVINVFSISTFYAIIPSMVNRRNLSRINGVNYFLGFVIQAGGPFIAAMLLTMSCSYLILWTCVIISGNAIIALALSKIPSVKNRQAEIKAVGKPSFLKEYFFQFGKGFRFLIFFPSLVILLTALSILIFLQDSTSSFLPYYIMITHAGSIQDYALISVAMMRGSIIGAIVASIKKYWNPTVKLFFIFMIMTIAADVIFALAPDGFYVIMIPMRFIIGFFNPIIFVIFMTILQTNVPKAMIGRISAIGLTVTNIISLGSTLQIGFISDVRVLFLFNAILVLILLLLIYFFTGIRKYEFPNFKIKA